MVKENSVIQINEKAQEGWRGCLAQVSEVKSWGVQAWVRMPMQGDAFIRLKFEEFDYIGEAVRPNPISNMNAKEFFETYFSESESQWMSDLQIDDMIDFAESYAQQRNAERWTKDQIIKELDECEHLDDAKIFFSENSTP